MLSVDSSKVKRFKAFLDDLNYDLVMQSVRGNANYFSNPLEKIGPTFLDGLDCLNMRLRLAIALFHCGEPVLLDSANEHLGYDAVDLLVSLGLLVKNGNYIHTDNYLLVSFLGSYFVVNTPFYNHNCKKKDADVYMGPDTYQLAKNIPIIPRGRVLDLCSGSGIQAILSARTASKVVGVEINPAAAHIARFNAILNDAENVVDIQEASLYSELSDRKFDLIISNPPFLPVPDGLDFSIVGDGGEDGLKIVREIVRGFDDHLVEGGQAVVIGEALSRQCGSPLVDMLRLELGANYDVTILMDASVSAGCYVERCINASRDMGKVRESDIPVLKEGYRSYLNELNITKIVSFTLKVVRRSSASGAVRIIDLTHNWQLSSIPRLKKGICPKIVPFGTVFDLQVGNQSYLKLSDFTSEIIKSCNSNRSIEEVYERMVLCSNVKSELQGLSKAEVIEKIFQTVAILERRGLLDEVPC